MGLSFTKSEWKTMIVGLLQNLFSLILIKVPSSQLTLVNQSIPVQIRLQ